MTTARPWNRLLWGVEFSRPRSSPILIGSVWCKPMPKGQYDGEPPHALLFTTRKAAREWCRVEMDKRKGRSDCYADWRFRAVRVRETARVVDDNP